MPKLTFKGLDEYIEKLEKLDKDSQKYLGEAIYQGAGLVADNLKQDLMNLPTDDRVGAETVTSIKTIQKLGLIHGMGIAELQESKTGINVKVGIHGYNNLVTKEYPNGQPNIMIARSLESGTSFMPKNKAISRSINKSKKKAEEAMKKVIEDNIDKLMK